MQRRRTGQDDAFGVGRRRVDDEIAVAATTPAVIRPVATTEIEHVGGLGAERVLQPRRHLGAQCRTAEAHASRRASGPPTKTTSAGVAVVMAGIAGIQPAQVAPHHHAAQAPCTPEGAGVAHQHLDHRCRFARRRAPFSGQPAAAVKDPASRPSPAARQSAPRRASIRTSRRDQANPVRPVLDGLQPACSAAHDRQDRGQIVGQRLHGFVQEILQFRNLVGDAPVVVDQMPQRQAFRAAGTISPRSSSERPLWPVGVSCWLIEPYRDSQSSDGRIVRIAIALCGRRSPSIPSKSVSACCALIRGCVTNVALDRGLDQGLAVRLRQRHDLRHVVAQELSPVSIAVAEAVRRLDASADPVARFEHDEIDAGALQLVAADRPAKPAPTTTTSRLSNAALNSRP